MQKACRLPVTFNQLAARKESDEENRRRSLARKNNLPKGTHHYRFVVDGHWQHDPFNETTEPNPYGG